MTARSTIPDTSAPPIPTPPRAATGAAQPSAPPEWLETAYARHHDAVYRAGYRVSGTAADAEDVLQTVFLRLLDRARRGPNSIPGENAVPPIPLEELGPYLNRAAVNASLDVLRARQRRGWAPLDPVTLDPADPSPDADPRRQEASRQMRQGLRLALGRLSPRAAEIFALRYFQGLGNQEIATQLGSSVTAVAVVLHRTRHRLRRELSSWMGA